MRAMSLSSVCNYRVDEGLHRRAISVSSGLPSWQTPRCTKMIQDPCQTGSRWEADHLSNLESSRVGGHSGGHGARASIPSILAKQRMYQAIVGFHQDELGDWVADLACGHTQHVRHQPPWTNRPWVVTCTGRQQHVGWPLWCKHCEQQDIDRASRNGEESWERYSTDLG